jgi:hypothetical protein
MTTPDAPSIADIYRALRHGGGRELVTDANVDALIQMANAHGDATNEFLLREWRSTCGDDPQAPNLKWDHATKAPYVHKEK